MDMALNYYDKKMNNQWENLKELNNSVVSFGAKEETKTELGWQ